MLETTRKHGAGREMAHRRTRRTCRAVGAVAAGLTIAVAAGSPTATASPRERVTVTGLATVVAGPCNDDVCSTGSTVGPDGALYVTDNTNGRVRRVDRRSGAVTTFADGLPTSNAGVVGGGVTDVAFRGQTAYVLVTGVSTFWTDLTGSSNPPATEGVYRLDRVGAGTTRATLVADLFTWSEQHQPIAEELVFSPGGFTYAMERFRDGFLVTDANHNRVLRVRLDGRISTFRDFGADVVPTGLELGGRRVLVGQAGPVPHLPDTGRVVALRRSSGATVRTAATGAPLLVDVELGRRQAVYGLSQGYVGPDGKPGQPALPYTGLLMRADRYGQFRTVAFHLDRPTSFELAGDTAYVVTITGKVVKVRGLR